jgi:hypothetical protein
MTIGPYDLIHQKDKRPSGEAPQAAARLDLHSVVFLLRERRLFLLMQSYLYRDPGFQIRAFLLNGDPADYVRTPLTPAWQKRVENLSDLLRRITAQTGTLPVILVYSPERAQAALAALHHQPDGVDPFVLGKALNAAATRNGVRFVDSTPAFAAAPDFQSLFYLTDGHPREGGHAALASVVEQALLTEPAFAACRGSLQVTRQ